MSDPEAPGATPEDADVTAPQPPVAREEADPLEQTERGSMNALSEKQGAELEARMREHGRPYEPADVVMAPQPPVAREEADPLEQIERGSMNALSEKQVAELEARMREYGRPYEPPTNK
jgi:hypothetical protein